MDPKDNPQDQPKTPDLSYQQDIASKDIRDIVQEHSEWEDSQWDDKPVKAQPPEAAKPATEQPLEPKEPAPTPATPPEAPKPPVETKTEEPKPVIDEEKLTEKIVTNLVDKLAPADATPEKKKDWKEKLAEMEKKAEDENRVLTYTEALEFLQNETKEALRPELVSEVKKEVLADLQKDLDTELAQKKQEAETQKKQQQDRQTSLNREWDRQLGILINQGKISKVVNADDPHDRGMTEQKALFEALTQLSNQQQKADQPVSLNLVEAFLTTYKSPFDQPGKDAPVNGSRKSVGPSDQSELKYQDLHKADLRDIVSQAYNDLE